MAQYGFHFDSSRCTGCKTCELVCKDYHDLGPAILFRRIYDYEGGTWTKTKEDAWEKTAFNYHVSISCNHCDSPACVENCPTGAMQKDEATGLVNTPTCASAAEPAAIPARMMRRASTHPQACATNATDALPACATEKSPCASAAAPFAPWSSAPSKNCAKNTATAPRCLRWPRQLPVPISS